ncbi:MAG: DUF2059 domain-containing protein [Erythrobacter sp.]|nr:DUF2059 domain-containing protein [Erythrobacter sp.]
MIKRALFATTAGLALLAGAPLTAQDENATVDSEELSQEDADALGAMFGNMFGDAEPLTPEQEARIPAAELVVERIFPAGTYAKMMNESIKPMMDGMLGSFMDLPINEITRLTGMYGSDLPDLGEGSINEIMAILDPAFEDRTNLVTEVTIKLVTDTMSQIEPGYRAGLARAYAVRFTQEELTDLNAYFATPTGAKYAGESMLIYADPQVMSAMNEMMPAMMSMMPNMMEEIAKASEQFPPARTFSDLSDAEKAKLAELLGTTEDALAESEPEIETLEDDEVAVNAS